MRSLTILSAAIALAAGSGVALPASASAQSAEQWQIGPIIRSRNYSVGMPLHPEPEARGWHFDFPYPHEGAGHVHYVTFNPGSLSGKSKIVMRYRVEAPPGVRFVPQETPDDPATVSLFFQRRGDNWSAKRRYEYYRWYAPAATVQEIAPGLHEMTVSLLDDDWISVMGSPAGENGALFADAVADARSVGLVFGSRGLRGHGVYATGPARFTLISFDII